MLSKDDSLSSSVSWKHVKSRFRGSSAYSAVEKSSQREELFKLYLETLDREKVCGAVCRRLLCVYQCVWVGM